MDLLTDIKSYKKAAKYFSRHLELILAFSHANGDINMKGQKQHCDEGDAQSTAGKESQGNIYAPLLRWSEDVGVWYVENKEILFIFAKALYDRHSRAKQLQKYMDMDEDSLSAFQTECAKMLNAAEFECMKRYSDDLDVEGLDENLKKQISTYYFLEGGGLSIELVMEFVKLILQYTIYHSKKAESKRAKNRWFSLNNNRTKGFIGLASMAKKKKIPI